MFRFLTVNMSDIVRSALITSQQVFGFSKRNHKHAAVSINVTSQLSFSRLHGVFKPLGSVYYDTRLSKQDLIKILGLDCRVPGCKCCLS